MTMPRSLAETAIRPRPDFSQLLRVLRRDGVPDHVPSYELFANQEVMEAVLGRKLPERADTIEFYYRSGYDYVPCWPKLQMKVGDLVDQRSDYPITDRRTFEDYVWPAPASISFAEFESVGPRLPDGMMMVGQTGGIFETAQELMGYTGLCMALADDRQLVAAIFERLGELYVAMYEGMASFEKVGALVISDDLGFKTQTLVSPADLREFVLPWHKKMAARIHAHGKPCILHSCGQLRAILEDLIEDVKIDAKHSYEDGILPVTEAKREFGGRVAILGGFDLDRLCRSDEDEIRAHTRRLVEVCGAGGGYALGSGNSIAGFVPLPNYFTMLDEGWKLR